MSDDIDIEEHGVMFPNLAIVKTETFEYDDEILDYGIREASPQPSTSASEVIPDSTTDLDVSCPRVADSPHFVTSTQEEEAASCDRPPANCIILGSKPTVQQPATDLQDSDIDDIDYEHCLSAAVELQDWGPFLENSRGFCKECEILFPTANALDVHKMSVHSFLVAVERNVVDEPVEIRKCDGIIKKECFVCRKSFENEEELIKHIYMHVNTSVQCDVCPETFFSKQLLEEHKLLHKSEEFDSDSTETELVYKCHICACQFARPTIFKRHMVKFHNMMPPNYKTYAVDLVCPHCASSCANFRSMYKHIRNQHKELFCLKTKPVANPKYVVKSSLTMKSKPQNANKVIKSIIQKSDDKIVVPKSALFKCTKCNVHFLNCSIAVLHFNNCNRSIANSYSCSQCTLRLKLSCQTAHQKQHVFGKDFDIFDISDEDIRPRILAHCPKCSVHFSEQIFWFHIENCDSEKANYFKCTKCCLSIDEKLRTQHEFNHKTLNYEPDDFIIIDYGDINSDSDTKFFRFYLCQTCKCFMNCHSKVAFHTNMYCENIKKNACSLCGLMFTMTTLTTHYSLHEQFDNYNLENFKFFNLTNRKMIQPIPEYHKCNDCNVFFHSKINLKHHKCDAEYKTCPICSENYSEAAYELHMPFHNNMNSSDAKTSNATENNVKETITMYYCNKCKGFLHQTFHRTCKMGDKCGAKKKYVCHICGVVCIGGGRTHKKLHQKQNFKLQDIIFYRIPDLKMIKPPVPSYQLCKKCRVHFCSKKDIVAHNCGEKNSNKCKICKINLSVKAYKLHMPFHSYAKCQRARKDTKASTSTVLTSKAKSITDEELIEKVPSKYEFYQCKRCKFCVTTQRHSHRCDAKHPTRRFTCTKCGLWLSSSIFNKHHNTHKNDPTFVRENFKIIPFSVTREKTTASIYQRQRKRIGQIATKNADEKTPVVKSQFYYTLLQCKSCKLCMQHRTHSLNHRCELSLYSDRRCECPKCGLFFNKGTFKNHIIKHKHDPTFVRKNIKIIAFAPKRKTVIRSKIEMDSPTSKVITKSTENEDVNIEDFAKDESIASTTDGGDKTTDATSKESRFTFFQCSSCKLCILNKGDTKYHRCYTTHPAKRYTCAECGLFLSISVSVKHKRAHENIPTFVRENFNIIQFSPQHTFETRTFGLENLVSKRLTYEDVDISNDKETSKNTDCNDYMLDDGEITQKCETYASDIDISEDENSATTNADDVTKTSAKKDGKFTFYQCRTCNTCFREKRHILNHNSCFSKKVSRYTCKKCGLFLNKRSLVTHQNAHRNPSFVRENFKIMPFPGISQKSTPREPRKSAIVMRNERTSIDESGIETESQDDESFSGKSKKLTETTELQNCDSNQTKSTKEIIFYQCNLCNLCVLSGSHKNEHCCLTKQPTKRYTCKKCGLFLSKLIAKKHKQAHQEDPLFVRENFKIIPFSVQNNFTESEKQEIETVKLQNTLAYDNFKAKIALRNMETLGKQDAKSVDDEDTDASDMDRNVNMMSDTDTSDENEKYSKYTFYQCTECQLCVHFERVIKKHRCLTKVSNKRYTCEECGLYLSKRVIQQHRSAHENDPIFIRENFKFIHFSPEKDFVFYQCSSCKTCWPRKNVAENHKCVSRRSGITYKCDYCGLILSSNGFLKHQASHKEDPTFHRANFQIIPFYVTNKSPTEINETETAENGSKVVDKCETTNKIKDGDTKIADRQSAKLDENQAVHNEREISTKKGDSDTMTVDENEESIKPDYNQVKNEESIPNDELQDKNESAEPTRSKKYTFYRCNTCDGCMPEERVPEHYINKWCRNLPQCKRCKKCRNKFIDSEAHASLHKKVKLYRSKLDIKPISDLDDFFDKINKKCVFQCHGCKTVLFSRTKMEQHKLSCTITDVSDVTVCQKCRLFICKGAISLEAHNLLHQVILDFVHENIKVINFDAFGMINETENTQKHTLYECVNCKTCVMTEFAIVNHINNEQCTTSKPVPCKKCGYTFSRFTLARHDDRHLKFRNMTRENIVIIPFGKKGTEAKKQRSSLDTIKQIAANVCDEKEVDKNKGDENVTNDTESYDATLYLCKQCDVHLMTSKPVNEHAPAIHHRPEHIYPCPECGLNFTKSGLVHHKIIHHEARGYKLQDFFIIDIQDLDVSEIKYIGKKPSVSLKRKHDGTLVKPPTVDMVYQCTCKLSFLCELTFNEHLEQCDGIETKSGLQCSKCELIFNEKQLLRHSLKHHSSDRVFKYNLKPSEELQSMLYRCGNCYKHFLKKTGLFSHLIECSQTSHQGKEETKCSVCKLLIHETMLDLHKTQHEANIINPNKYIIITYITKTESYTLYRCNMCDSNFLAEEGLIKHLKHFKYGMHSVPVTSVVCDICEVVLNPKGLQEHTKKHHRKLKKVTTTPSTSSSKPDIPTRMQKTENKDEEVPKEGDFNNSIYYCEVCRLHFENENSFLCHYKTVRKYQPCDVCALVFPNDSLSSHVEQHHVKLNLKLEDFHIIKSTCVKENPAKDKTLGKPVPANKEKIEKKVYFKCKNCNVTFLNRKNCLKHIRRHIPLPEYDFVACKICNKNFLVDSLRYHMLHHKSMELNDSTLLTITYSTEYDLDESNITKMTNKFLLGKTSLGISEELTDSDEESQNSPENASDDENNSDNIHSCHLCKKKYKTERARDLHVNLDHLDEEKACPICNKTYHLSILNDLHLCMKNDLFKCCMCGNVFPTLLIDNHSREHLDSRTILKSTEMSCP